MIPLTISSYFRILCKLLEKHILTLMHEHLQESMVLSATQWGFRSDRSTVTALISVTQDWYTALEQGNEICAVFFFFFKKLLIVFFISHLLVTEISRV